MCTCHYRGMHKNDVLFNCSHVPSICPIFLWQILLQQIYDRTRTKFHLQNLQALEISTTIDIKLYTVIQ